MEAILRKVNDPSDLAHVQNPALPYRFDRIFSAKGFGAKRLEKKRLKLMKAIDAQVQQFLVESEKVEFVSWGIEYSFAEHYFMGIWAMLLNRRAIVLTNRRLLLVQINSRRKPLDLKFQVRYAAIEKLAKGTFGYLGLVLRDKKTLTLTGIPRKDRKALRARIGKQIEATRSEPPVAGRENLCPYCGHRVVGYPVRCNKCAKAFKNGARAGWLSLALPGLGDLYLGHRILGTTEIIGALMAWGILLLAYLAPTPDSEAMDIGVLAGLAAVVFLFVHGTDAWVTRRMGMKGIYPES